MLVSACKQPAVSFSDYAAHLADAEGQVAPLLQLLCALKSGAQLVDEGVSMLFLAYVLQQVPHNLLEALLGESWLTAQI